MAAVAEAAEVALAAAAPGPVAVRDQVGARDPEAACRDLRAARRPSVVRPHLRGLPAVLRVRLASDSEMYLPLEYGRWSFPSVNFLEDL